MQEMLETRVQEVVGVEVGVCNIHIAVVVVQLLILPVGLVALGGRRAAGMAAPVMLQTLDYHPRFQATQEVVVQLGVQVLRVVQGMLLQD
jgi:hypothetical protein